MTAVSPGTAGIPSARTRRRYLETPYASLQLLLVAGLGLLVFGVLMSASTTIAASVHTTGGAVWSQLIKEIEFVLLSVPVFWVTVRLAPSVYRKLVYPVLGVAVFFMLAVLVPGIGVTINGAARWIQLGPFTIQPSEFAKLAILLWGADLLTRKQELRSLTRLRHVLVPLVPGFLAMIALVMIGSDLGTTACFLLILLALLWMVGLPVRFFGVAIGAMLSLVALIVLIEPYRMQRITTFLHPNADAQGAGYHTMQGLYALSSGGLFGVGLGQGTSKYGWVPNANTDYVFAIVGEELGLLGCLAVLLLFGLFTYAAMRIALRSRDPFVRLVASGAAIWIAGQALINIGYVTALLPVTGIPLPFISNGGTSLLLTCAVLGMLVSFARHEPDAIAAAQRAAKAGTTARWIRLCRLGTPRPTTPVVRSRSAARVPSRPATAVQQRPSVPAQQKPSVPARQPATRAPAQPVARSTPQAAARASGARTVPPRAGTGRAGQPRPSNDRTAPTRRQRGA
ncbi:MAG TPA: putative lipid II flippase FtsW [Jatrophihabitans sp.]|nr:putative lipid II flippase FtsW [Jatrophihabitans sp.]